MTPAEIAALLGHAEGGMLSRYADFGDSVRGGLLASAPGRVRRADAGRRLEAEIGCAAALMAAVERRAWRDYHGETVCSASSLALAIFAHERLDLDAAVRALGPDGDEDAWLVGCRFGLRARKAWRTAGGAGRRLDRFNERDRFLHARLVVRRRGDPAGALGVRFSAHGLEVGFGLGGVLVRTVTDQAVLQIEQAVPETVKTAIVGRPVGDLIDHPVLRDPALVVMGVDVEVVPYSLGPNAWTMTVRAPRLPWRAPWARGGM